MVADLLGRPCLGFQERGGAGERPDASTCWATSRASPASPNSTDLTLLESGCRQHVVQLLDYLKETQLSGDGPGANELANQMQETRSALHLLCASDTVDLADSPARRVWSTRPTDGRDDRRAEFRETLDLLRRFTHQLRQEIARS